MSDREASVGVEVERVSKRYGDVAAVDSVSLSVRPGAFVSLLGPSGCGKTTLLRLVGGFETPDAGAIRIGGTDVTRQPPQKRPTAMVFQSYALFPTMSVGENVAYGLRNRGISKFEAQKRGESALHRVDLGGLGARSVAALSGGQQQRVALARALAVEPAVLLFDEPLSNLDLALREATRAEMKSLQRELGTTSLYVTHDQQEALALSDHIAVMRNGTIVAEGAPETLYAEPPTAYIARFLGGANVIADRGLAERLSGESAPHGHVLAVRPEALEVADASNDRSVQVRLRSRQFLGVSAEWHVSAGDEALRLWLAPGENLLDGASIAAKTWRWVPNDIESTGLRAS